MTARRALALTATAGLIAGGAAMGAATSSTVAVPTPRITGIVQHALGHSVLAMKLKPQVCSHVAKVDPRITGSAVC